MQAPAGDGGRLLILEGMPHPRRRQPAPERSATWQTGLADRLRAQLLPPQCLASTERAVCRSATPITTPTAEQPESLFLLQCERPYIMLITEFDSLFDSRGGRPTPESNFRPERAPGAALCRSGNSQNAFSRFQLS